MPQRKMRSMVCCKLITLSSFLIMYDCLCMANFKDFLANRGESFYQPKLSLTDAINRKIIQQAIDISTATRITHTSSVLMDYERAHIVRNCSTAIYKILENNADFLKPYPDIFDYYNGIAAHIRSLDNSKHWQRALDSYVNIPLANAYEVRKWMLDESLSIVMKYPEEVELQRTIQALQLINEERDRTRLAELINGGWKADDRILSILNGE